MRTVSIAVVVSAASASFAAVSDDPFADRVVSYTPGTGVAAGFDDPTTALGAPTRFTSPNSPFGGATTPFQGAFGDDEVVTVGEGGSLTVAFDTAVTNDALNPFGIDLLIFGNQAFFDADFPNGVAGAPFADAGGVIEVSADGINFIEVPNVTPEGGFPTLGFLDPTAPLTFGGTVADGTIPSDFTKPVDPSFDLTGLTLDQILAGYDGSGGGLGIDIGALGLDEISYVRITNPFGSGGTPEVDAFADVRAIPSPSAVSLVAVAGVAAWRRRRA